jgi:hypothetical protein
MSYTLWIPDLCDVATWRCFGYLAFSALRLRGALC